MNDDCNADQEAYREEIPTSLEIPLIQEGKSLRIDLSDLPIFFGLSILSKDITYKVINRHDLDRVDVEIEKMVKHSETPELAALQIENIKVTGDYDVLEKIIYDHDATHEDIRTVFGTLQMQRWRNLIYPPEAEEQSRALIFPRMRTHESGEQYPFRIILERLRSSKKSNKYFLRVTIESLEGRRLDLNSFPHEIVENPEDRTFIGGSTRISQLLAEQVSWEAQRGRRSYSEVHRPDSFVFNRFAHAGLEKLVSIEIAWAENYIELLHVMEPVQLKGVFKKILLLLEDHTVRGLLEHGETIRVDFGELFASLNLSQLGRTLNISFGQFRMISNISQYLQCMPSLNELSTHLAERSPLKGIRIFLIHHVTAEILALIGTLRQLGAEDVDTLFVHYGEEVSGKFLEALLGLDQKHFRSYTLNNVEKLLSVEGYFVLSPRFSSLQRLEQLQQGLRRDKVGYYESMKRTAIYLFLEVLLRSIREGDRCLVIEDGGYIIPLITEKSLDGVRLIDLVEENGLCVDNIDREILELPLSQVLDRWLIGSVEHTKNGQDQLTEILEARGELARPVFSIATSNLKVHEEASEVAASILSAIESVLHTQGKVLSHRKILVMGSEGSIGGNLLAQLQGTRIQSDFHPVLGIDLRKPEIPESQITPAFATHFKELPKHLVSGVDLIIGVTGVAAFRWEDMETLLFEGQATSFYLASGSTKTIEFEDVSRAIEQLMKIRYPVIRGMHCQIEKEDVLSPQTQRNLGRRYRFVFKKDQKGDVVMIKEISFLGNLMPINFLYYGVPGEIIDSVLLQLLRCAIGLIDRVGEACPPEKTLYAVDHEIDVDGKVLDPSRPLR